MKAVTRKVPSYRSCIIADNTVEPFVLGYNLPLKTTFLLDLDQILTKEEAMEKHPRYFQDRPEMVKSYITDDQLVHLQDSNESILFTYPAAYKNSTNVQTISYTDAGPVTFETSDEDEDVEDIEA